MNTYRDILQRHIQNQELLNLLEHLHKKYPVKGHEELLSKKIDGTYINPFKLINIYVALFDFEQTKEGFGYWNSLMYGMHELKNSDLIYEWKHISEWFEDENIPQIIKKDKELYIQKISEALGTSPENLYFFELRNIFIIMKFYNHIYFRIPEECSHIVDFYKENNRFPNDFDI